MEPNNFPALPYHRPPGGPERANGHAGHRVPFDSPPLILTGHPTFWSMWAAFRRQWRLAVSLGLVLGVITAVAGWYFGTSMTYTAVASLKVESQPRTLLFKNAEPRKEFDLFQKHQIAMVKSRYVLAAALRDDKVRDLEIVREQIDPIDWLQREIKADFNVSPEILQISMSGKEEGPLLLIVKAVQEAYLAEVHTQENEQRKAQKTGLEKLAKYFAEKMEDHHKELRNNLKKDQEGGYADPEMLAHRQHWAQMEISWLQQELLTLRSRINNLKAEEDAKKEHLAKLEVPAAMVEERLQKDPQAAKLQKKWEELRDTLEAWKSSQPDPARLSKETPYQKVVADYDRAEKELIDLRKKLRPEMEEELREKMVFDDKRQQAERDRELKGLERLEKQLNDRINSLTELTKKLGDKGLELEQRKNEIAFEAEAAKKAANDAQALAVEMEHMQLRIDHLNPKDPDPYLIRRENLGYKVGAGAGLAGLLAGILGISLLEFLRRRVSYATEVSHGLRLPIVGTLPLVQNGRPRKARAQASRHQILIESVDVARTLLLHQFRQKNLRVVMITSAGSGEGKTLLSAHLAGSLARAGSRVLLVDGDLRRPSLHKVFGLGAGAGLGEALRGEADLRDVVRPGPIEGLWVVPAGVADGQSLRALVHGVLNKLFEGLKQEYDFIIVDSAPVLPVADSQLIAQSVDGVILSVLQNVSRLPSVYAAYERLMLFQANLLGVILHGGSAGAYDSQYPYLPLPLPAPVAAPAAAPDTKTAE